MMKEKTRRKLEAQLARLRQSEAIRFLAVADDVGLFDIAMTRAEAPRRAGRMAKDIVAEAVAVGSDCAALGGGHQGSAAAEG